MIKIPMLSTSALKVFEEKTVVLYSIKPISMHMISIFRTLNIRVHFVCVEDLDLKQFLKMRVLGLRIVKKEYLQDIVKKHENVIVQAISFDSGEMAAIEQLAKKWDVEYSNLTSGEIASSFSHLVARKTINNCIARNVQYINNSWRCRQRTSQEWMRFKLKRKKSSIVVCSPPKTADHSLNYTFDAINQSIDKQHLIAKKIHYVNIFHRPRFLKRAWYEKKTPLKIIMGVREPISQNLSDVYQGFSAGTDFVHLMFEELANTPCAERKNIVNKYSELSVCACDDVQKLFDIKTECYLALCRSGKTIYRDYGFIQLYISLLQRESIDILIYPFDQVKGYSIIKKDNMEIFIYQLEKLNDLIPLLSDWVGVPFDKLENGNQASDKWISESYKQAQKEIEITQEYFDRCFDEPYVKHCYSEADIEKFKAKWRPHIKR